MRLAQFRVIAPAIDREIAEVFARHGLKVAKRSASVEETLGTVNYRVTLIDTTMTAADGSATSPERIRWERYATVYGLKPEWLGQTITLSGKAFVVAGLRDTRGAKNVSLTRSDGKTFIGTSEQVVRYFAHRDLAAKANANG